jgi:hypothetical protein
MQLENEQQNDALMVHDDLGRFQVVVELPGSSLEVQALLVK